LDEQAALVLGPRHGEERGTVEVAQMLEGSRWRLASGKTCWGPRSGDRRRLDYLTWSAEIVDVAQFNLAEAKARLSELVERALSGEDVVIGRRNEALVRLVVLDQARTKPQFGKLAQQVVVGPEFDDELEDFAAYQDPA
jgi:prevent-host-death family protein